MLAAAHTILLAEPALMLRHARAWSVKVTSSPLYKKNWCRSSGPPRLQLSIRQVRPKAR